MSAELSLSSFYFNGNTLDVIVMKKDNKNISYFVAKRVAQLLGYGDTDQAVRKHCKNQITLFSLKSSPVVSTGVGLPSNTTLIPESDVYRLAMKSKLKSAVDFQDFVCDGVLPSIREFGCYPPPGEPEFPQLPETQQQHHVGELERVNKMTDEEKKTERKYKLIEAKATVLEKDSEVRKRGAKTREDNRKAAQTLLAGLLQEKTEWEDLQQDYEEHLGWLNQQLFVLDTEKKELEIKNREKSIYILNHIRELRRVELEE